MYLWPLLGQRFSNKARRHTLYVFEGISDPKKGSYLRQIELAAIDTEGDPWILRLEEAPADSHAWLLKRLGDLPQFLEVPREMRLGERLHPGRR